MGRRLLVFFSLVIFYYYYCSQRWIDDDNITMMVIVEYFLSEIYNYNQTFFICLFVSLFVVAADPPRFLSRVFFPS